MIEAREVLSVTLSGILVAAVYADLRTRKIPNCLAAAGTAASILTCIITCLRKQNGAELILALGGAVIPLILLLPLWRFRMIGAGDIKLLAMLGSSMGPAESFDCVICTFLIGGILSLILIIRRGNLKSRFAYLVTYLNSYIRTHQRTSYISGSDPDGYLYFSIPILLGYLCYLGGLY